MNGIRKQQSGTSAATLRRNEYRMRRKRFGSPQQFCNRNSAENNYDEDIASHSDSSDAMEEILQAKMQAPLLRGNSAIEDELDEITMESEGDGAVILVVENGPLDSRKERIRNRLFCDNNDDGDENASACSTASTAMQDPETHATAPETPPPASHQSVHSSSDSSRAPLTHEQQHNHLQQPIVLDPSPSARSESQRITPIRRPGNSRRSRSDSFPEASKPKPLTFSNPFSCYSPELRHARRKEIMGMSILTYIHPQQNHYENDDTNSISQVDDGIENDKHPSSSPVLPPLDDDSDSVATENAEELLELAARRIRTDLLRAEMTELAREAERAAENGDDSFAAQPCVFQEDMAAVQQRRTTGPPKPLRRSQSESAATIRAAASVVAASYTLVSATKLSVVELRDVNEVFPAFRQFHTHLRTHFFRSNVSQNQLLFDEPAAAEAADNDAEGAHALERLGHMKESPSMTTVATPLLDRSEMLMCRNHASAAAAAAFLPMCTNATTATPLPPSDRKRDAGCSASVSSSVHKKTDFLSFNFGKWVKSSRGKNDKSGTLDEPENLEQVVPLSESQELTLEGWVGDLVSGHLAAGDRPLVRPKMQVPPGLESVHLSMSAAARRLQPKQQQNNPFRDRSYAEWEYKIETHSSHSEPNTPLRVPMNEAEQEVPPSLPPLEKLHHIRSLPTRLEPRALFDSTQFDSDDEDDDDDTSHSAERAVIKALVLPPARVLGPSRRLNHEIVEQSNNSLVEEELLHEVSHSTSLKALQKMDSLRTAYSAGSDSESHNPTKMGNPDFVTPVHLRTIRGTRTTDFAHAGLLLPSNSLAEESPLRMSKHSFFSQDHMAPRTELDTVLDVSDSLNISEHNRDRTNIVLPGFVEQTLPGVEDFRERTASTPSPSPVDSPFPSPRRELFSAKAMSLEDAVALNSSKSRSPSPPRFLRSSMTFPSSPIICPPKLLPSLNSVDEYKVDSKGDASAPTTPPSGSRDGQQDGWKIAGTPDSDIVVPIDSAANALRISPYRFDLPFKSKGSKSLPPSPVTAKLDLLDSLLSERGNLDWEKTPMKASSSVQAGQTSDFDGVQHSSAVPETPEMNSKSCGFLTLSPAASHVSDSEGSDNGRGGKSMLSSRRIRRSTSTGALFDKQSSYRHHKGKSIRAAMNVISNLSPKSGPSQRQRALYVRTKENDAFINNFLYCSKPNDDTDDLIREAFCAEPCNEANRACGEIGSAYCCTSFIERTLMMGRIFPAGKHGSSNHHLFRLSDTDTRAPGRIDPDSWFDITDDRFGCGFDPIWNCTGRPNTNPAANVSFQAPSLKKSNHNRPKHSLKGDLADETETDPMEEDDEFDEKKWDGIGLYDIDDSIGVSQRSTDRYVQHARHLSFMADESESSRATTTGLRNNIDAGDHPHHVLSDKQFQLMYGLSRGSFEAKANNVERDFATSKDP